MITIEIKPNVRGVAAVTNARIVKGVRGALQKDLHSHDLYGLEFYHVTTTPDKMLFDVLSPYGHDYVTLVLEEWATRRAKIKTAH